MFFLTICKTSITLLLLFAFPRCIVASTAFYYPLFKYDVERVSNIYDTLRGTIIGSIVDAHNSEIGLNIALRADVERQQAILFLSMNSSFVEESSQECRNWGDYDVCVATSIIKDYLTAEADLVKMIHKISILGGNFDITVAGHSRGAALAAILSFILPGKLNLVLFGCPPLGNKYFNERLHRNAKSLVHVVWKEDPVPVWKQGHNSPMFEPIVPLVRHLSRTAYVVEKNATVQAINPQHLIDHYMYFT